MQSAAQHDRLRTFCDLLNNFHFYAAPQAQFYCLGQLLYLRYPYTGA